MADGKLEAAAPITVKHLMTHTSGLTYVISPPNFVFYSQIVTANNLSLHRYGFLDPGPLGALYRQNGIDFNVVSAPGTSALA
jgi:CubicO group peptidase (beta-lactamase class C family)